MAAHRPRGRSAPAAAPSTGSAFSLVDLNDDLLTTLGHELCDPLRPLLAVHLSSTAKGLRGPMRTPLQELEQQHAQAKELASIVPYIKNYEKLRDATMLDFQKERRPLTLTRWGTLGNLVRCQSLPRLTVLRIIGGSENGDLGLPLLAAGLFHGCLPSLKYLSLHITKIGAPSAEALASALSKRTVPVLEGLSLSDNRLGDAGLSALAPSLRRLPALKKLSLGRNLIGDAGVASLVAPPTAGVLKNLDMLHLSDNRISNAGCIAIATAARNGAFPALEQFGLNDNPGYKKHYLVLLAVHERRVGWRCSTYE
jgi:hypothetical protein